MPLKYTRTFGIGSLGIRSLPFLQREGDRLLSQQHFDLIYFSTTVFNAMSLGPRWRDRFGIPYVLDFQDPWQSDYYAKTGVKPPGGKFKYSFAQLQAKILEPKAIQKVSHIISVSPTYPEALQKRYPYLSPEQFTVLPFGAPELDFEVLPSLKIQQRIFDPNDGKRHWVYVGRGGNDMALALRSLFLGLQEARHQQPELWQSVHLHFVGTSYAPQGRAEKTVEPIARELGVADLVTEHPYRIPYFEALQVLVESDGILLIGSDDASYTASKLYPCVLARKPILAIFHHQSSVVNILNQCNAGRTLTFKSSDRPEQLLSLIAPQLQWLLSIPKTYQPDTDWQAFQPYTAKEMTRQQCMVFDRCLVPTPIS
ncbi:hypothetical protein [Altericista sp. CCNU0014]|uniref:hypothetical protein n=1 Tax=Altericista sp. CCNU0014 TaxID=3082949 RepID=UPI00384B6CE1